MSPRTHTSRPIPESPGDGRAVRAEGGAVFGVVLAAGRSTRMGTPKALLESDGRTLLARATAALLQGGCERVLIVVSEAMPEVVTAAGRAGTVVPVPDLPGAEPVDSLRAALAALPADAAAAVVLPVDCPFVRPATVTTLIDRVRAGDAAAVVPVWHGADGHPVALHPRLFARIAGESLPEGLRTLLADGGAGIVRLAVDDEAVTVDLDTPADAARRGVRA